MRSSINNTNNIFSEDSGTSPMDNISNMSDAMLVLAVGIMLALVLNWKIDIKDVSYEQQKGDVVEENKLEEFDADSSKERTDITKEDVESNYIKSGTVYTDTATGKTYVIMD